MNRNFVGSIYMYERLCIKFPQSRMKGEQHRFSPLSHQFFLPLYCLSFFDLWLLITILVEFMILKHQVQVNKTSQIITVYFLLRYVSPLSILLICLFSFSLFISHIKIMVLLFFNIDYKYTIQKDLKEICHRMFITVFCVTLLTLKFIDNFNTLTSFTC